MNPCMEKPFLATKCRKYLAWTAVATAAVALPYVVSARSNAPSPFPPDTDWRQYKVYIGELNGDDVDDIYLEPAKASAVSRANHAPTSAAKMSAKGYLIASSAIGYATPTATTSVDDRELVELTGGVSVVDESGDGVNDLVIEQQGYMSSRIVINGASGAATPIAYNLQRNATGGGPVTHEYRYDPLGRLIQVRTDGAAESTYCYDKAGNRTTVTQDVEGTHCPTLEPPERAWYGSHQGGGWTIQWSRVEGATLYRLSINSLGTMEFKGDKTAYSTRLERERPIWIEACDALECTEKVYF